MGGEGRGGRRKGGRGGEREREGKGERDRGGALSNNWKRRYLVDISGVLVTAGTDDQPYCWRPTCLHQLQHFLQPPALAWYVVQHLATIHQYIWCDTKQEEL